jgi:hypothetical protein
MVGMTITMAIGMAIMMVIMAGDTTMDTTMDIIMDITTVVIIGGTITIATILTTETPIHIRRTVHAMVQEMAVAQVAVAAESVRVVR